MQIQWINTKSALLAMCVMVLAFAGVQTASAAGPMDQGFGWSASYYQVLGDDSSCAADEVRYDVEYVDAATGNPVSATALLVLFDKDSGNSQGFRVGTNGSVGSVCYNPDDHDVSVSIDETGSYYAYWSMYREENPEDIPRQKHIQGRVWLIEKGSPSFDFEHRFPSVGTDEILTDSPDFQATVNELPNLLGATDLSEATVFVYDLIDLELVDTFNTSISGGTGVKDLGTVPLPDGRYSWGFYLSMNANHDAGSLLGSQNQPNSSFSGLSGNFRIDSTDPNFSNFGHSPGNPNENQAINLQVAGRDVSSNGFFSGTREVRVYFDGALVQTCTNPVSDIQNRSCNVNVGTQVSGTYNYYAEVEDWAGNVYTSVTNTITVAEFFNSTGSISGSGCSIATGASDCAVGINWSTSDFIGTPNVVNRDTSQLLSTDTSGSLIVNVGPTDDIFDLSDTGAGTIFTGATFNANVGCADSGAYWNGSVCALQPAGSITGTTCGIATGNSSCQITLNWTTSDFLGSPSVIRDANSSVVSNAVSGSQLVSVSPNDDIFRLVDNGAGTIFTGASYNANVSCADSGDVWNGSICQPIPTGSISGAFCEVPVDGTGCLIDIDWTSTNFFGTPEIRQGSTVLSNSPSATNFTVTVDPDNNLFSLNDTGSGTPFPGNSFVATVTCASGSLWDGSTCSPAAYDSYISGLVELSCQPDEFFDDVNVVCVKIPTASITGTSCQIPANQSTCQVTLDWLHNNPVGSTVVEQGAGIVQYGTLTVTGFAVAASPNTDLFTISDDGYQSGTTLGSYDAKVGCVSGYFWNGTFCQAIPAGSISGTSCTIDTGDSSCDVSLSWSASNFFGTPEVRRMSPNFEVLSTALSGTNVTFATNPDNDRFRIVDLGVGTTYPGDIYDANVKCTDADSAWNGSACVRVPQGTLSATPPTCIIPVGGSSCSIDLTWTTSDFVGTPLVQRVDGTFISNALSGTLTQVVNPAQDQFTLTDTGAGTLFPGILYNANVTCDTGAVWNSTSCIPQPIGSLSYVAGCQIQTGDSDCDTFITWSTTDFVGQPAVRQSGVLLSNALSATNYPVTVTFGNNEVRLQDTGSASPFGDLVRNLYVTCADSDDTWNGSVCAPDLQSGFAVSGQGQVTGCPSDQFLSTQTGSCQPFPIVNTDAEDTWTRYGRSAVVGFSVQAPYETDCTISDVTGNDETIIHNAGAGVDGSEISYQTNTGELTSAYVVSISCIAPGMGAPVTEQVRANVIPVLEEV